ncbi:MAG: exonuclease SbcCD subunit D [Chloroflexi bacterium]|jgi:exonuclease SbcD|nr:exonuclease SbcCD subunit D [Chloroflexota bacterium]
MIKFLHFADAHIDMANFGKQDPETGLPLRVIDFLNSLDEIVESALTENVDLVIFAGDTYKDRAPAPTFQREWGKRIMRLSRAGILTLLLTGNHDISPATGRAHAIQEFDTLDVPHVRVVQHPQFLTPADLEYLSVQVLALPWISRTWMLTNLNFSGVEPGQVNAALNTHLFELVNTWLEEADPELPTILTAHASVEGAAYGSERMVMLTKDLALPSELVKNPRFDYVALGHIHKAQNLNEGAHPPVIYPGSIERVNFGEAGDRKFFVTGQISKGNTQITWHELKNIRPFLDIHIQLESDQAINRTLQEHLPPSEELLGAILRMVIEYPREWEPLIDENELRTLTAGAFEFHLVKRPHVKTRVRLPKGRTANQLSVIELLDIYWETSQSNLDEDKKQTLIDLAKTIIAEVGSEG